MAKSLAYSVQKRSRLGFDARGTPRRIKQSGLGFESKDFMKKRNSLKQERIV